MRLNGNFERLELSFMLAFDCSFFCCYVNVIVNHVNLVTLRWDIRVKKISSKGYAARLINFCSEIARIIKAENRKFFKDLLKICCLINFPKIGFKKIQNFLKIYPVKNYLKMTIEEIEQ